ncbi:cullin-1 [Fusarium longipes]|uniref:Cullin-1 n=1 Tax=Fusarium longipes TaxID=694270 RepID=A0A395T4J5_9HYPO|nr:cullin-1 [Fusarium longipes]
MESLQTLPAEGDDIALYEYLQAGVAQIHNNPESQLPINVYMNIYSATWTLTSRHKREDNARNTDRNAFPSAIIYQNLTKFLATHLHLVSERILSQDINVRLQGYLTEWERYNAAAKRVDHLLNLINRHWIKQYVDEGNREVFYIHVLHCVQWRDHLWEKVRDQVVDSAQNIMKSGDGDIVKAHNLLDNFASLHIDETDARMKIGKSLENPFVSAIEAHYKSIDDASDENPPHPLEIPAEGPAE